MPTSALCPALALVASLAGFRAPLAAPGPLYLLPFPVGSSYPVLQGYDGKWGHQGAATYAYDFQMPIGSRVAAARAGVVVRTEASHADATRKGGEENFVFVDHGDGTFGRYYHLTRGGVLVAVGQRVVAGQEIGRSGDSGASASPHLHFDVTRGCPDWGCQTIPVRFGNSPGNPLLQGQEARALPPGSADDRGSGAAPPRHPGRPAEQSGRSARQSGRSSRQPGKSSRRSGKLSRRSGKLSRCSGKLSRCSGKLSGLSGKLAEVFGKLSRLSGKLS